MMTDDGRTAGKPAGRGAQRHSRRSPDLRCRTVAPPPARDAGRAAGGSPLLEIRVPRTRGERALAAVTGEIDLQTADLLRARLIELHACGYRDLVVDFAGVAFCDAAGLGALVAVHNRVRESGGGLRLARVRPAQRKLLRVTGLHRVFALYDDLDDAMAGRAPSATAPRG